MQFGNYFLEKFKISHLNLKIILMNYLTDTLNIEYCFNGEIRISFAYDTYSLCIKKRETLELANGETITLIVPEKVNILSIRKLAKGTTKFVIYVEDNIEFGYRQRDIPELELYQEVLVYKIPTWVQPRYSIN